MIGRYILAELLERRLQSTEPPVSVSNAGSIRRPVLCLVRAASASRFSGGKPRVIQGSGLPVRHAGQVLCPSSSGNGLGGFNVMLYVFTPGHMLVKSCRQMDKQAC